MSLEPIVNALNGQCFTAIDGGLSSTNRRVYVIAQQVVILVEDCMLSTHDDLAGHLVMIQLQLQASGHVTGHAATPSPLPELLNSCWIKPCSSFESQYPLEIRIARCLEAHNLCFSQLTTQQKGFHLICR